MPVLRVHPVQDDDPGLGPAGRGAACPGLAGDVEVRPDWEPVATRIRKQATDRLVRRRRTPSGSRRRGSRSCVDTAGWRPRPGGGQTTTCTSRLAASSSTRARGRQSSRSTAWRTRRTGPTGRSCGWRRCPGSLVVIGGGAIGCELAQVFSRFGVDVRWSRSPIASWRRRNPRRAPLIARVFTRRRHWRPHRSHDRARRPRRAVPRPAGGSRARGPTSSSWPPAATTTSTTWASRRSVSTRAARAWTPTSASGPVSGCGPSATSPAKGAFTHVSMYQAAVVVRDILGEDGPWADYHAVSRVTFTDPEVGSVGITEKQARDAGPDRRRGSRRPPESSRGWIHQAGNDGLIKLVADAERGVLVGGTAVGPSGGEVLGLLAVAVHAEVPISTLRDALRLPDLPPGDRGGTGRAGLAETRGAGCGLARPVWGEGD